MMRISELRHKDVIDNEDGRRLGYIRDIEIDVEKGGVEAIVVPEEGRIFGFFRRAEEQVVPWSRISKIGVDVILIQQEPRPRRNNGEKREPKEKAAEPKKRISDQFDDVDFFNFD